MRLSLASRILATALLSMVVLTGCASAPVESAADRTVPSNVGGTYPISIPLEDEVPYKGLNHTAQQGGIYRSAPQTGTTLMEATFTGTPQANWIYVDETFAVSTLDNRGCAPAPQSIDVLSSASIVVNFGQDACTFEYYDGPYTSELDLPPEATGRPLTVSFRFLDETIPPTTGTSNAAEVLQLDVLR